MSAVKDAALRGVEDAKIEHDRADAAFVEAIGHAIEAGATHDEVMDAIERGKA